MANDNGMIELALLIIPPIPEPEKQMLNAIAHPGKGVFYAEAGF